MSITIEQAIEDLKIDNMVTDRRKKKDLMAGLIVYGIILHGNSQQKVRDWIFEKMKFTSTNIARFSTMWDRLVNNNVICDDGIHLETMPDEDGFGVEFALLMTIALGLVERVEVDK